MVEKRALDCGAWEPVLETMVHGLLGLRLRALTELTSHAKALGGERTLRVVRCWNCVSKWEPVPERTAVAGAQRLTLHAPTALVFLRISTDRFPRLAHP